MTGQTHSDLIISAYFKHEMEEKKKRGEMISASRFQYFLNLRVVDLAVAIPYYA